MGTPKTDPDYEHSETALREKEGEDMGTKDLTHEALAKALTDGVLLTHEQRAVLLGLVADDKVWQREADKLRAEVNDLSMALHHADSATQVAVATAREKDLIALREWAVNGWRSEVQFRPMVNKNRRSLDDCWRQVMRYAGLDPVEAVGPSHDDLLAAGTAEMARRDALGPWEDRA